MKTNMKLALSLITVPYGISFLGGMFGWYMEDGMYMLIGFSMLAGIIWAWIVECNRG